MAKLDKSGQKEKQTDQHESHKESMTFLPEGEDLLKVLRGAEPLSALATLADGDNQHWEVRGQAMAT